MVNEIIRVCLIGTGRAGLVHANSLMKHIPGAQLAALVDENSEILEAAGERFGVSARFPAFEQALEKAAFDAVVITTPTFTHCGLTVKAASAGKHIFCEKPMALNLAECDEMIGATSKRNLVLQLGFMRRFDLDFEAAYARIQAGEIGQPMIVKSLTHGPGLPPPWARDSRLSNGMLAEVNSHDWDCTRWLAGSNPSRVYTEVANFKGKQRGVDDPGFYDNALVNIRFRNGALGSISGICPCEYGYDARVEIVGERGIMQIGGLDSQAVLVCTNRNEGMKIPIHRTWPDRFRQAYIAEMAHFLHCIRTDSRPRAGGEEGRWAVAGVLAATQSFRENRPVELVEALETIQVVA